MRGHRRLLHFSYRAQSKALHVFPEISNEINEESDLLRDIAINDDSFDDDGAIYGHWYFKWKRHIVISLPCLMPWVTLKFVIGDVSINGIMIQREILLKYWQRLRSYRFWQSGYRRDTL